MTIRPTIAALFLPFAVALLLLGCGSRKDTANSSTAVEGVDPAPVSDAADAGEHQQQLEMVVDVQDLVGKPQSHVAGVVGSEPTCEPDNVPDLGEGERCKWASPKIDALFFDGALQRVEISGLDVEFAPASGAAYGLDSPAAFQNDNVIRWELTGFEASMFPGVGGQVDYLYVKKK